MPDPHSFCYMGALYDDGADHYVRNVPVPSRTPRKTRA